MARKMLVHARRCCKIYRWGGIVYLLIINCRICASFFPSYSKGISHFTSSSVTSMYVKTNEIGHGPVSGGIPRYRVCVAHCRDTRYAGDVSEAFGPFDTAFDNLSAMSQWGETMACTQRWRSMYAASFITAIYQDCREPAMTVMYLNLQLRFIFVIANLIIEVWWWCSNTSMKWPLLLKNKLTLFFQ